MPLDAAEFISELSITDPTGTDPLNQGDDQIRTVKRATQQSFPNVNAAVPQTAAQMAQMAIKNEANTFTQINTYDQPQHFANGTELLPGIAFSAFPNQGWRGVSSTAMAGSTDGIERVRFSASQMRLRSPIIAAQDGSGAAPTYAFEGQPGTGMYRPGTSLGFAVNGSDAMFLLPAQFRMIQDGTAAAPAYSFQNDTGMGMYRIGADVLGFSTAGVERLRIRATDTQFQQQIRVPDGSAAAPAYSFLTDAATGFYASGGNNLSASIGGTTVWAMSTNGMFAATGFQMHVDGDLPAATPGWTFSNDPDTGMFRIAANAFGFANQGLQTVRIQGGAVTTELALFQRAGTGAIISTFAGGTAQTDLRWAFGGFGGSTQTAWAVSRFGDTGAFINNPFSIDRATGQITLANIPTSNPGGNNRLWKNGSVVNIT